MYYLGIFKILFLCSNNLSHFVTLGSFPKYKFKQHSYLIGIRCRHPYAIFAQLYKSHVAVRCTLTDVGER